MDDAERFPSINTNYSRRISDLLAEYIMRSLTGTDASVVAPITQFARA